MRKKIEKYISLFMENELVGETALVNPYLKLDAIDEPKVLRFQCPYRFFVKT